MSDAQNTAPAEGTTQVETAAPAEVVDTQAAAPVETTDTSSEATQAPATDKEDYSWVPQKFLKADGSPDWKNLAKNYVHLEKKKPNVGAASVDDYQYELGEEYEVDAERSNAFKEGALKLGFTPEQYKYVMDTHKQMVDTMWWTADRTAEVLKQEWGDDFKPNQQAAARAFNVYAPSDLSRDDPVWNHPGVMKLLATIGADLGEDSVGGKQTSSVGGASVQEQIAALRNDPDYWNNPQKQALMERLYAKLK